MLKFLKPAGAACLAVLVLQAPAWAMGDAANGEKVFKKCKACHAVGEGAENKVGPQLNDLFGRAAGGLEDFKYSKAMLAAGEQGVAWNEESLNAFLEKPKGFLKGTRMSFAGLRKQGDRDDLIAYLRTFSADGQSAAAASSDAAPAAVSASPTQQQAVAVAAPASPGRTAQPGHGVYYLGRVPTPDEIAAWDIDIRPDGLGLPEGRGTVRQGEAIFAESCAVCHGDFGEGRGRWPVLAGGFDTLTDERPVKTIGSYWPYLSTVYDYVRRAMPFGLSRSLSDNGVYSITAYLLYLNDVVTDEDFELSHENFAEIRLPNEGSFLADDRTEEAHYAKKGEPCMTDCKPDAAEVTMRARVLDVTPEGDEEEQGVGAVD